ncbi:hypothetical protein C4K24_1070 [Pseudomonas chlororaphis subsp. aurantiaca]|nr:hypothetical protein C4K24_1070 [Pseudomonas chlororaphis subsp. aurantiaca]
MVKERRANAVRQACHVCSFYKEEASAAANDRAASLNPGSRG